MSEIRYLLGIDGGGTKTDFLLTDINGKELRRVVLGPSNPVNAGMENTENCLREGIEYVCEDIDKKEISVFAGIAGGTIGSGKENIHRFLENYGFGKADNGSDIDTALEVCLEGEKGLAVIIGTGIAGFADNGNTRQKIGGWGYLIDKGGSGFHLGSDALDSALRFIDGRGGSEMMLRKIEEKINSPLPQAISHIYKKGNSYIASLAPIVFECYENGDKEAERILLKNTEEIAVIIKTGYNILNDKNGKFVLCGGLCKKKEILKSFLSIHLGKDIRFEFCDRDIVFGALSLARKNAIK